MLGLSSTTTKDGTIQVPLTDFKPKCHFFLFTSLYSKRLFWVIFWANTGTPEWFHFCAPFQGFPQVQYSCKTLKMLTAPNMDPQTLKTQVFCSLPKNSRNWRCTNNKKASHGSPRPWWLGLCFARFSFCPLYPQGLCDPHSWTFRKPFWKIYPNKKHIDSDMLFWQDGSFLGLETQIDPYTISGYMLALLAMLLQELRKNMLVGSAESKTNINLWGLCYYASCPLLAIVSPGSMLSPLLGFAGTQLFITRKHIPWYQSRGRC